MTIETIAAKIAKLIAKADSSTHPEEADTFMTKAQALLEAHGISMLDLGKLGDDAVGHDEDAYRSSENWKNKLANQLAIMYGCTLVTDPVTLKQVKYVVFGRESARVTFTLMFPYILRQVQKLANIEQKAGRYATRHKAMVAVAGALTIRIYRMNAAAKAGEASTKQTTGVNALVPVDIIEAAVAERFPQLRMSKATIRADRNAHDVASRVSLHRQTSATSAARQLH